MYDRAKLEQLKQEMEKWIETSLQRSLAQMPERRQRFITTSSEPVERLYTPLDVADMIIWPTWGCLGVPFTRGVHPRCTAAGYGLCACSRFGTARRPTPASNTCSSRTNRALHRL